MGFLSIKNDPHLHESFKNIIFTYEQFSPQVFSKLGVLHEKNLSPQTLERTHRAHLIEF
jgi:hypothetical protein